MKRIKLLHLTSLLVISFAIFGFKHKQSVVANTLTFGGVAIAIDATDCSAENSSDGKSLAIAAINMTSTSGCVVQFGKINPDAGTYTTVAAAPIGEQQVLIGLGGPAFGGAFTATAGQQVVITNTNGKYHASFSDVTFVDDSKKISEKKLTGDFGCD